MELKRDFGFIKRLRPRSRTGYMQTKDGEEDWRGSLFSTQKKRGRGPAFVSDRAHVQRPMLRKGTRDM